MSGNADNIHIPGPEEDALINAGIAEDADTFELDAQGFEDAMASSEAIPISWEGSVVPGASRRLLPIGNSTSGWTPT